jgi:hypothetical protein
VKDIRLVDLNFREIVDYGGQPQVQNRYSRSLACRGYCISCEESGLLKKTGGRLGLMSHGCDSTDFEDILRPMPREGAGVAEPIPHAQGQVFHYHISHDILPSSWQEHSDSNSPVPSITSLRAATGARTSTLPAMIAWRGLRPSAKFSL